MNVDQLPPVFEWIILTLAVFRIQRVFTADSWYPTQAWRKYLVKRAMQSQGGDDDKQTRWTELAELFSCPWCWGFWVSAGVLGEYYFVSIVPIFVYAVFAISAVVGMLAAHDGS